MPSSPPPSLPPSTSSLLSTHLYKTAAASSLSLTLSECLEPRPVEGNGAGDFIDGEIEVEELGRVLGRAVELLLEGETAGRESGATLDSLSSPSSSPSPPSLPPVTFVDIGSGRGQCVLAASLLFPLSLSAIGVEIDPVLSTLAGKAGEAFGKHSMAGHVAVPPRFFSGDAFSPPFLQIWRPRSHSPSSSPPPPPAVVYCCCTAFSPPLLSTLSSSLSLLPPSSVAVTLTHSLTPSPDFKLLETTTVKTDWSPSVAAYIHRVNPRAVLLFYKYVRVVDVKGVAEEMERLAGGLELTGRIRVAEEVRERASVRGGSGGARAENEEKIEDRSERMMSGHLPAGDPLDAR